MGRQYVVEEYYKGLPVCIVFLRHTLIGTDKVSRIVWIKAAIDAIAEWDEVHTRVRDEKGNLVTGRCLYYVNRCRIQELQLKLSKCEDQGAKCEQAHSIP